MVLKEETKSLLKEGLVDTHICLLDFFQFHGQRVKP
jgi:hypothetical protein